MTDRPKDCGCAQGFCWVQHVRDMVERMRAAHVVGPEAHSPTAEEVGCRMVLRPSGGEESPSDDTPYNRCGE